jgi:hypothetical protein
MSKNVGFIITNSGNISLLLDNRTYLVNSDHVNYKEIINCLKQQSYDGLHNLLNFVDTVVAKAKGEVTFSNGAVYWNGNPLHNSITDKILKFYKEGLPYEPLLNMIKNLWLNPSENSREQIYRFLESNNLPITPDGCILFYKRVSNNYTDIHTGTFDNSVGKRVFMPRNQVVEDPEQTCSSGLHVCSLGYLKSFGVGNRIVVCKVNPAHIVSVPVDYHNTKVRVSEYLVVGEWSSDEVDMFDGDLVRNDDCSEYDYEDESDYEDRCNDEEFNLGDCCGGHSECRKECDANINNHLVGILKYGEKPNGDIFYNVRDKTGKFVKV